MSNVKEAAATMGRKGGKKKSTRKAAASRKNGKLGGRPRTLKFTGSTYVDEGAGTYVEKAS
jgi:hypothetical protein